MCAAMLLRVLLHSPSNLRRCSCNSVGLLTTHFGSKFYGTPHKGSKV